MRRAALSRAARAITTPSIVRVARPCRVPLSAVPHHRALRGARAFSVSDGGGGGGDEDDIRRRRKGPTQVVSVPGARGPNREALNLYREILRTASAFTWVNEKGEPWSEVLKRSARQEFEEARHERDPMIVARLLLVGRDCLMQAQNKAAEANQRVVDKIDDSRGRGPK